MDDKFADSAAAEASVEAAGVALYLYGMRARPNFGAARQQTTFVPTM